MYKRMTKSAYNRPVWHRRDAAARFDSRQSRCIFAPFTRCGRPAASIGPIARVPVLRAFFLPPPPGSSPRLLPTVLETHFYPEQFRRLLLTFLSPDRRTFHCVRACARASTRVTCARRACACTRGCRRSCDTFFIPYAFFPPCTRTGSHIVRH